MVKFTKILKKHNLAATIAYKIAQNGREAEYLFAEITF